jgi:microcystin-dependent protein
MGLESGTYIEDLVASNPLGTDGKAQGDNHIRLIKQVLQNQFPSLGQDAVTGTAEDINEAVAARTPEGGIIMWAGTTAQVPSGWQLCNGIGTTNTLSISVPNLTSRFVIGSITDTGGTYNIGETGGSSTVTGTTQGHALTEAESPEHRHFIAATGSTPIPVQGGTFLNQSTQLVREATSSNDPAYRLAGVSTAATVGRTSISGSGDEHTHGISITGANIPPYYALAYIIYLG